MKRINREIALFLTLCMVFTSAIPAYAEDVNIPVMTAEMFEAPTEIAEVAVEEAVAAMAVEAIEAELTEGEAGSEIPTGSAEKAEQAAMLGEDGVTKETVTYFDWDDTTKQLVEKQCTEYTVIDSSTAAPEGGYTFESGKWYVVKETVTFANRIKNNAAKDTPAHLILTDGCEFNVPNGIQNFADKELVIYGQQNSSGRLLIEVKNSRAAGIGGDNQQNAGTITINGGFISASGGEGAAGIGGGCSHSNGGTIIINGGTVDATGGTFYDIYGAAGIGGGWHAGGGTITINGGNVTGRGGCDASGIGHGSWASSASVNIEGGTVTAYGGTIGGKGIGEDARSIKSGVMIYAGDSRETAKRSNPEGISAKFVFISDACPEAAYTVYHKCQKADPGEYEVVETKTLYGGVGWQTEATANSYERFTAQEFSQKTIASDGTTVINILYNRNTYTIAFDMNGRGTDTEPIKAGWGTKINPPQAPVCEGYRFEGWYTERECSGNPYTFSTMPEENLTLYAKWDEDPSQRRNVQYVDEDGSTKEVPCIILSEDKDFYAFDTGEWYAVTDSITINHRIENRASEASPSHLILKDGASLAVKGGIHISGDKGLIIYGQSMGNGMLSISDVQGHYDGIGSRIGEGYGRITIDGGTVVSTGGWGRAGIGGKITINGGTVTATGAGGGAGIGGAWMGGIGNEITINGGTITATGAGGAAIGAGNSGAGWTLVFGIKPAVLKAGANKDDASDVDVDIYKDKHQDYGFVTMNYATASYTVEHWKQKTVRGEEYQYDTTDTLTGYINNYAKVVSKEYPGYGDPAYTPAKIKADGTTKIVAKYDLLYSTISFDANGHGTAPDPIYAVPGAVISAPKDPFVEGYTFGGWFTDAKCTNQFTFSTMPSEDKILYAKWTPIQYTITWKDGAKVLRTDKVAYDAIPDYGPDPVKQGYEFLHWWPAVQKVTGDATYNAIFFKPLEKYTVTWMLNDIKLIDTTEVSEGEMPVHENPEREGYIFIGWQPALAPVTGNVKYTAYFEERGTNKIAVTFHTDGGTFIDTQVIDRNTTPVKPSDPQKAGCRFEGWYREPGFITPYNFDEPFNMDMTLYAKWEVLPAVVYTVTWNMDNGTLIDTTRVNEGEMPVHENPSKDGYIFVGWNPAPAPVMSDITYTARFEKRSPDKAAVTFNTDGGSFVETQVITKGQKAVRPSDPAKTGYEFVNWYADAAFAALYDFNTTVTADITVYAKWKKTAGREYTITWKDWNGSILATSKVAENGLPKYPGSKPSRSGYIFTGWTPEIDLAYADRTYTATYEPKSSGGGGGGGSGTPAAKKPVITFSPNWYADSFGVWRIKNSAGQVVTNAWLCDDAVAANGQNVWYLLTQDGAMLAAGLVQDATGSFYSLETNHDGYFGMLRYTDGYYNCNGQQVYLKFSHEHNGTFGAVINAEGIEKLKAIYGVTQYGIGNENAVYTKTF